MLGILATITLVTLAGSFACSIFEAAFYAIPLARVRAMAAEGRPDAKRLLRLRESVDEPIAAILTLNTITHTVGASVAGGIVLRAYGDQMLAWYTAGFTLAMLLLTEIIPKTLGVRHATKLGPRFALPIQVLIWVQWPLIKVVALVTNWMGKGTHLPVPSEQEILSVAEQSRAGGAIRPHELRWVRGALKLDDTPVADLMKPRSEVESVVAAARLDDLRDVIPRWNHSRLVVTADTTAREVVGFVLRRDIVDAIAHDRFEPSIAEFTKPVAAVRSDLPASDLVAELLRRKEHLAIVRNAKGDYLGIVTLEDALERLLGEDIVDEFDERA